MKGYIRHDEARQMTNEGAVCLPEQLIEVTKPKSAIDGTEEKASQKAREDGKGENKIKTSKHVA